MRWLKHTIAILLLLAAAGVVLATAFSDPSDDYGQVPLPQGGTVHLPEGKVTVYHRIDGQAVKSDESTHGLAFRVTPVGGGQPISLALAGGQTSDVSVIRKETIGELDAIAKLDVPASGEYVVQGSTSLAPGTSNLAFGTNAGSAVLEKWRLLAGLLLGALLLAVIPVPRSGRRRGDPAAEPTGWSSDPRAPYAG
jgi:hypothetical protein